MRATPSAPTRAISTCGPSTPSRSSGCRSPSTRPASTACWARISSAPALTSTSRSSWARARSSAARETALMTSIEGCRGEPRPRPPSRPKGPVRPPHHSQQRRDLRQHPPDHPQGRRLVPQHGHPPQAPAPRCSRWAARSRTPALSRSPWAPPCARSSRRSAAASPAAKSSRPPRPAAPSGGCIPAELIDTPSTTTTSCASAA